MTRARFEFTLAAIFGIAAVATAIWPTWIESLVGLSPDKGSGAAEWWLVALLGVVALVAAALGRRDHKTAALAEDPGTG